MLDLKDFEYDELVEYLGTLGEPKYRAQQIFSWLHKGVTSYDEMTNISAKTREKLSESTYVSTLKIREKYVSKLDGTIKYLFELPDGNCIESVIMRYSYGISICVSSQVGCRMGCRFCASTIGGLYRNLTAGEILNQIIFAQKDIGERISNIVLMGIGEPLDNFENVVKFLQILSESGFSLRRVSLSTCGVVDKIRELAKLRLGVTLSVSLHAASDEKRSAIMPINRRFDLKTLMEACDDYFDQTGRRISFEYSLIEGVNDDDESADELITLLGGKNCHINLIPINEVKEREFRKSRSIFRFQKRLNAAGLNATVRRTLGADINAACGQLRRDDLLNS